FWATCCAESGPGKGVLERKGPGGVKAARLFIFYWRKVACGALLGPSWASSLRDRLAPSKSLLAIL
ncbi:MAG: hypothetical protein KGJ72_15085, partial [Gammaproteobacteria bacterium]|nr:hypothetical protein [Gammaproteobacteria bacterium]